MLCVSRSSNHVGSVRYVGSLKNRQRMASPKSVTSGAGSGDLVAVWDVKLPDGLHRVEFEHGTTSGRRLLRIDGKDSKRKKFMFKLVGHEQFDIGGVPCVINIDAASNMKYVYTLDVNGQSYERYQETTARTFRNWTIALDGQQHKITLDTQTLDLRIDGVEIETSNEFTDYGSQLSFTIGSHGAAVQISTSNAGQKGIGAKLVVDNSFSLIDSDP